MIDSAAVEAPSRTQHPWFALTEGELYLVLQLVLASGSLKDLAEVYKVSYPTIRLRMDRLMERVRAVARGTTPDPMTQLLADLVERGEIAVPAAQTVRALYRRQMAKHYARWVKGGQDQVDSLVTDDWATKCL
jgi:hypothetical protein